MASLFTALSGLKAHQDWIDVIGNNLANANTSGFKTSHASFSSSFHSTLRHASGPGGGMGGRNPVQIGMGVSLSDIGRDFGQGSLTGTGRVFDLALQGRGFFALSNGAQTMYTRVGTFGLDGQNNLVDQRTGYRVLDGSGSAITLDTLKGAIGAMAEGHIETTAAMKAAVENSGLLKPQKGELLN